MGRRSVIGTTDTRVDTPFTEVTDDDIDFLLGQINARMDLDAPLTTADIIAERCGVRPLVVQRPAAATSSDVDWTKLSRASTPSRPTDRGGSSPIFGGKLTDCLNVGEEVADEIEALGVPLETRPAQLVRRAGAARRARSSTARRG